MDALTAWLLLAAGLLLTSILASKASTRFGVPALLLFLAIGMLAGSDGPGGIWFDDTALAQSIGVVALAFILFSGGLDTPWNEVRPVLGSALSLATLGIMVSAAIVGAAAHVLLNFPLLESVLLGAIVSSTDAAAVFGVLRAQGLRLRKPLQPLIELESGSNDPMAVFLTTALIERLMHPATPLVRFLGMFALEMSVGAIAGLALGRAAVWLLNRIHLDYEGLYPLVTLAFVLLTYGATDALHGNGFLAVYVAGVVVGDRRFVHRKSILRFHDGIAWLMQITMFLALGLLVFPRHLVPVAGLGLTVALVGTFVARPIAVFLSLAATSLTLREKLFVSWAGLRGAVPIILATFAMTAKLPGGTAIFNVVFFTVIVSVLIQGMSLRRVATLLGVLSDDEPETDTMSRQSDLLTIDLPPGSPSIGRQLVELPLSDEVLVLLVFRRGRFFPATGTTRLAEHDRLMVFASKSNVDATREVFRGVRSDDEPPGAS